MTELQRQSQQAKEILTQAVAKDMEKKRRLGQYAVIFRNGEPTRILPGRLSGQGQSKDGAAP